jgi:Neuraminidase (sialidase)
VTLPVLMSVLVAAAVSDGFAAEGVDELLEIAPSEGNPRNGEGDILKLQDGRLALVYTRFVRGGSDHSPADLAMRMSSDGGKTWSDDRILVPNEAERNVMSVSLLRERKSGDILVFYLRKNDPNNDCLLYVRRSSDELKTVGEPVCATPIPGYQVVNNDRVIQLSSGRLLVAAAHHTNDQDKFTGYGVPISYYSDDGGRRWEAGEPVFPLREQPDLLLQEPGLVELKDGRVWMYMRTGHGYQYGCVSNDQGVSWTRPEPIEALASPRGPATIERMPWTGDLFCVWIDHTGWHNHPPAPQRSPLAMKLSPDDGKTWTKSRVLGGDPQGSYCYMSVTFLDDRVLLSYYAPGGLKVVSLTKDWVLMQ